MSIVKEYGVWCLVCDCDGFCAEERFDTWAEAKEYKPEGWTCRKVKGEYEDHCPECSKAD